MASYEDIRLEGHIIDSLLLPRILDDIQEQGGDYQILEFRVGRNKADESSALLRVKAAGKTELARILQRLEQLGAEMVEQEDVSLRPAPADGVFPEGFYSTTNLETYVRLDGSWISVKWPEMDCGVVIETAARTARTVPIGQITAGDLVVVGTQGLRVLPVVGDSASLAFQFMGSSVSSEKPKRLILRRVAQMMRETRSAQRKIIAVLGPAVIHTGAAAATAGLVADGWIDVLFGGNAIAAHDIEASLFNTSLGVDLTEGTAVEGGHEHHLRAINRIRGCGGIRQAVDQGVLTSGLFYQAVKSDIPFVLAGSIRDDGPLPDVITDCMEAQQKMREHARQAGLCLMLGTMLHSIATGNLLPATVPTVSVDIDPAVATKLADRGTSQAIAVVTDVGLFIEGLATELRTA